MPGEDAEESPLPYKGRGQGEGWLGRAERHLPNRGTRGSEAQADPSGRVVACTPSDGMKRLAPHAVACLPRKIDTRSEAQGELTMEHVAIDLGRPNSVKCEMGVDGKKVMLRFRLNRKRLDDLFGERARCRVLIESSTDSEWVALHLEGLGHEVIVADPNYAAMYGERNRRVKTDNRDAAALFDANRLGIYREAYRRSSDQRRVIGLLRIRMSLVRTRTRW